jgi:hypothetical protein
MVWVNRVRELHVNNILLQKFAARHCDRLDCAIEQSDISCNVAVNAVAFKC